MYDILHNIFLNRASCANGNTSHQQKTWFSKPVNQLQQNVARMSLDIRCRSDMSMIFAAFNVL